jgi:hypothetical protein
MEPLASTSLRSGVPDGTPSPRAAVGAVPEPAPSRGRADVFMRRLLRLPDQGPRGSVFAAQSAFSKSIAISATRCLLTYVAIPLLGPIVGLTGSVGPVLGLLLGTVSMVAIVASTRRFFAADHRFRWGYAAVGGSIFVLLVVQAVVDLAHLLG